MALLVVCPAFAQRAAIDTCPNRLIKGAVGPLFRGWHLNQQRLNAYVLVAISMRLHAFTCDQLGSKRAARQQPFPKELLKSDFFKVLLPNTTTLVTKRQQIRLNKPGAGQKRAPMKLAKGLCRPISSPCNPPNQLFALKHTTSFGFVCNQAINNRTTYRSWLACDLQLVHYTMNIIYV